MTRAEIGGLFAASLLLLTAASADPASDGAGLLAPFKADLKAALMAGLEKGPAGAIEVCRTEAPGIAAALSSDEVSMGRTSHRLRNSANEAPQWVAPIVATWTAADAERTPVVVELADDRAGYVEPIMVQPMCLACHGETLAEDVAARIATLYPADQATGFSVGDFRGVFWVEFPKRD